MVLNIPGHGALMQRLPLIIPCSSFSVTSLPFLSTNIGCTPGIGNVAHDGLAGVTPARRRTNNGTNAGSSNNGNSNTSNQGTSTVPAKEKGWSDAAKGTAIGAGSGAVLGAILSKNKAKGAVIGGVIGGAGGYAIGRSKDRKSGRVARQKRRRAAGY